MQAGRVLRGLSSSLKRSVSHLFSHAARFEEKLTTFSYGETGEALQAASARGQALGQDEEDLGRGGAARAAAGCVRAGSRSAQGSVDCRSVIHFASLHISRSVLLLCELSEHRHLDPPLSASWTESREVGWDERGLTVASFLAFMADVDTPTADLRSSACFARRSSFFASKRSRAAIL